MTSLEKSLEKIDKVSAVLPIKSVQKTALTRLVGAVQIALLGLALYLLTRAAIAFFAPESLWEAPPSAPLLQGQASAQSGAGLDLSYDPFHRDQIIEDEIIEIGTGAPETTLNLKLVGRRAGPNGSAILENSDRSQKAYGIGDEIMSGVTLKAVHPGYIVLSQGGRIERLTFERESETSLLVPDSVPNDETTLIVPMTDATSDIQATFTSDMKAIPKSLDINAFMTGVSFAPQMRNGNLAGYQITPKSGFTELSDIGLRSGDIITQIGEVDLTSPTLNPASIPAKLSGVSTIPLTLIRDGKTVSLTLGK